MVETFLKVETIFRVPQSLVFEALTNPEMIKCYTQSETQFELKEGGKVSMYGGYIEAEVLEFEKDKSVRMKWRFNNWKESCICIYKFSEAPGNETAVKVLLKEMPTKDSFGELLEHGEISNGFKQQIFDKISTWIGYAQNKDEVDSD